MRAHAFKLSCEIENALGEGLVPRAYAAPELYISCEQPNWKGICTFGICSACMHACREAASAEIEHRTMMDAKAALEQMALFGKTDLYGPLADGLGRCVCQLHCSCGMAHACSLGPCLR